MSSADFFFQYFFKKILSGISSEFQNVWIQISPDVLSGLLWVQNVCKGYQQTPTASLELTLLHSKRSELAATFLVC